MNAVCIRCGAAKEVPWDVCAECSFEPKDSEELVRSVYLSTGRYDDNADKELYRRSLTDVSHQIRRGVEADYDEAELARLREQRRLVNSVPMRAVWGAVFRLFLPALLVIVVLLILVAVFTFSEPPWK